MVSLFFFRRPVLYARQAIPEVTMKIGVLETGPVADALQADYVRYGRVFETMLRPYLPEARFEYYVVYENQLPAAPDAADGWLITGSKFGAYEAHSWIPPLEHFLRSAYSARVPIVGICFGHQILAQALGGTVVKSEKGWGLGRHIYDVTGTAGWLNPDGGQFASHAIHQDQVTDLPDGAHVLATSDFCAFAALAYGDPDRPDAITVQPHPELDQEFLQKLIAARRDEVYGNAVSDAALETIGPPVNNDDWARWISEFFKSRARG